MTYRNLFMAFVALMLIEVFLVAPITRDSHSRSPWWLVRGGILASELLIACLMVYVLI